MISQSFIILLQPLSYTSFSIKFRAYSYSTGSIKVNFGTLFEKVTIAIFYFISFSVQILNGRFSEGEGWVGFFPAVKRFEPGNAASVRPVATLITIY